MNATFATLLQVFTFLASNKDTIKGIILSIESLIPSAAGDVKATQLKDAVAKAMGIEAQIESVWPMVQGVFNVFVAQVKGTATVAVN